MWTGSSFFLFLVSFFVWSWIGIEERINSVVNILYLKYDWIRLWGFEWNSSHIQCQFNSWTTQLGWNIWRPNFFFFNYVQACLILMLSVGLLQWVTKDYLLDLLEDNYFRQLLMKCLLDSFGTEKKVDSDIIALQGTERVVSFTPFEDINKPLICHSLRCHCWALHCDKF